MCVIVHQYSVMPRMVNRSYKGRIRIEMCYLRHLDPVDKQHKQINQVVHKHCYSSNFPCIDECFRGNY